jgi:hypothetical protein
LFIYIYSLKRVKIVNGYLNGDAPVKFFALLLVLSPTTFNTVESMQSLDAWRLVGDNTNRGAVTTPTRAQK